MDWNAIISAFGSGGQVIILLLLVYLLWTRNRDEHERKQFQQRMDERVQQLLEWTVKRAIDNVMPERKSGDD